MDRFQPLWHLLRCQFARWYCVGMLPTQPPLPEPFVPVPAPPIGWRVAFKWHRVVWEWASVYLITGDDEN